MNKAIAIEKTKNNEIRIDWINDEVQRCLNCYDPPCQKACPASIPIPNFIRSIKSGNMRYAADLIRNANPMAATCGAVCPEEVFCQTQCTRSKIDRPIMIRELHSYATVFEIIDNEFIKKSGKKAAIMGSGPAGLSCAIKLAEAGIDVTIFEREGQAGGVPSNSIPEFRLNDEILAKDIQRAVALGIEIKLNSFIENPKELLDKYNSVFVAAGLSEGKSLNIPGENLPQVIHALQFLEKGRKPAFPSLAGKRVAVIGGGNVSLDVASTAARLGASETHLLYRRGPNEIKVWESELREAQEQGVIIDYLVAPVEFISNAGNLQSVKCIRTRLTEKIDSSGRRIPENVAGTEFALPADLAIIAVGLYSEYAGKIKINNDLTTSIKGIFAGGDFARGEGTIVEAVHDGKLAAQKIISYLKDKDK